MSPTLATANLSLRLSREFTEMRRRSLYLLAAIALFGCEFNAEYERMNLVKTPVGARAPLHA